MVEHTSTYVALVRRGIWAFDAMGKLVLADLQAMDDWSINTNAEAQSYHDILAERLLNPQVSIEQVSTLLVSISHFCDRHWADYREFPVSDPVKQMKVQRILDELAAIGQELSRLLLCLTNHSGIGGSKEVT